MKPQKQPNTVHIEASYFPHQSITDISIIKQNELLTDQKKFKQYGVKTRSTKKNQEYQEVVKEKKHTFPEPKKPVIMVAGIRLS